MNPVKVKENLKLALVVAVVSFLMFMVFDQIVKPSDIRS